MKKSLLGLMSAFVIISICIVPATVHAEVAIIVHPSNTNSLNSSEISRIFLGKKRSFPDGSEAIAVDQKEGSPSRNSFVTNVLKKSGQQMKAYWAQLLFTGKGRPPKEVGEDGDVKRLISQNPALIGYIDSSKADDSVKVVHKF